MAKKAQLRLTRAGTIINVTSTKQESEAIQALEIVVKYLLGKFGNKISLIHESQWYLNDIVKELRLSS